MGQAIVSWSANLCGGSCAGATARRSAGRHAPACAPHTVLRSSPSNALRELAVPLSSSSRSTRGLEVRALDAAMPFDFEHRARHAQATNNSQRLKIGIVGFGTFGQFLARRMVQAGHEVIATSRTPYYDVAEAMGVDYFTDADDFCEEHPDVVVLATSILSMDKVLRALPIQRLKRNTLFVDVLSVKEFPKTLLLQKLPPEMDILCTHPMYGPDSGKGAWTGLPLMYERVRVGEDQQRRERCDAFLQFFESEGCRMVEMTCEEHDQMAASTQFITHTVGRMLGAMELTATPIDTKGFQSLLSLVDNTANDSFELYYGLFMYNQNATQELEKLEQAFDRVKRQLFTQLHNRLRDSLGLQTTSSSVLITKGTGGGRDAQGGDAGASSSANGSSSSSSSSSSNGSSAVALRLQQQAQPQGAALVAAAHEQPAAEEAAAAPQESAATATEQHAVLQAPDVTYG